MAYAECPIMFHFLECKMLFSGVSDLHIRKLLVMDYHFTSGYILFLGCPFMYKMLGPCCFLETASPSMRFTLFCVFFLDVCSGKLIVCVRVYMDTEIE